MSVKTTGMFPVDDFAGLAVDEDRLSEPVCLDALLEHLEFLVPLPIRVVGVGLDGIDGDVFHLDSF
jgi:hypothetical protein